MEIKTKFNFGQRVQAIVQGEEQYKEPCPLCDGTGMVQVKETIVDCFHHGCYGGGFIIKTKPSAWYVPKDENSLGWSNFVIQKIGVEMHNPNNKKVSDKKSWIYYMADSSGTMWNENNLFATIQEAQTECDNRNQIIENERRN
jgi:hypothetical protein